MVNLFKFIQNLVKHLMNLATYCNNVRIHFIRLWESFDVHKVLRKQFSNNVLKFWTFFCLSNVHHSFPKLENIFMLMIINVKKVEIGNFISNYIIGFKHGFGPLNYKFWLCVLMKSYSFFMWWSAWIKFMSINYYFYWFLAWFLEK